MSDLLADQLRAESLRRLAEGEDRIKKCLRLLSPEQVWHRPNERVASVGNLVLHLCGNVGQWINSTLGGLPDDRNREWEFFAPEVPVDELLTRLAATLSKARHTLAAIPESDLTRTWSVQGFQETGTAIIVHAVEHFSYHVGQITLHTKLMQPADTGYYDGLDLNATG
ncbi:MAG: DUF1572 family protein [Flavobacteriales bacterium]|nr:DUF1572 family protein [Flavobacteriales bacterium]